MKCYKTEQILFVTIISPFRNLKNRFIDFKVRRVEIRTILIVIMVIMLKYQQEKGKQCFFP